MNKNNAGGGNSNLYEMTYGGTNNKKGDDAFLASKMQAKESNLTVVPAVSMMRKGKTHRDSRDTLVLL